MSSTKRLRTIDLELKKINETKTIKGFNGVLIEIPGFNIDEYPYMLGQI